MTNIPSPLLVAATLSLAACAKKEPAAVPAQEPAPTQEPVAAPEGPIDIPGFEVPESVLYLADQDLYLVSNIKGGPLDLDDNGFISKMSGDGTVIDLRWIDASKPEITLNAPKGMAVRDGKLYVTDITHVRVFDLATGAPAGDIEVPGATFLNDLAAAGDKVYVSDSGLKPDFSSSGTDAVYAIGLDNAVEKLGAGAELRGPNGLVVVDGQLWVVTFGSKELFRLDGGQKVDVTELPTGGLDGVVVLDDGRIAVTSWEGKAVYAGKPGAPFVAIAEDVESPADLGVDTKRKRLAVPIFMGNAVRLIPYP